MFAFPSFVSEASHSGSSRCFLPSGLLFRRFQQRIGQRPSEKSDQRPHEQSGDDRADSRKKTQGSPDSDADQIADDADHPEGQGFPE